MSLFSRKEKGSGGNFTIQVTPKTDFSSRCVGRLLIAGCLAALCLVSACRNARDTGLETAPQPEAATEEIPIGSGKVVLTLDRKELTTTERVTLRLQVDYPEGMSLSIPSFTDQLGQFRLTSTATEGPELSPGSMLRETHVYHLEPFLPGDYEVPTITVELTAKAGASQLTTATTPISVRVRSVFPEGATDLDPADIAGPLPAPENYIIPFIIAAFLFLAAALGFFFYFRRKPEGETATPPPPPPHVVAERALIALLAKDFIKKGEIKTFFIELSAILRCYIEGRFQLRAPERTTEEFLYEIRGSILLDRQVKEMLALFLNCCDLVKFAKHRPLDSEIHEAVEICRKLIRETSPVLAAEAIPPRGSGSAPPPPGSEEVRA